MSLLLITLLSIISIITIYVWYEIAEKYRYWEKKKVPHLKPTWPFGTLKKYILLKQHEGTASAEYCRNFPDAPYVGGYLGTKPVLYVKDPEYIKTVLVKGFAYLNGREQNRYANQDPLHKFIFFAEDDNWKVLRQNLTPLYSSGKMKNMFPLIAGQAEKFERVLKEEIKLSPRVNVRELMARFTMDCISSCAFGVDSNLIEQNSPSNPFRKVGQTVFFDSIIKYSLYMLSIVHPKIFYGVGLRQFPPWIFSFFKTVLEEVFKERQHKPSNRHDFVDLIFSLRDQNYLNGDSLSFARTGERKATQMKIDEEVLLAQCIGIFLAGYETSATTMSYVVYHIAKNERVQALVHREVDNFFAQHEGKLTYDIITKLNYLMACIDESLRICSVSGQVAREVLYDYTLPDGLKIETGTQIIIPTHYLHHCPKYFPEPEVFRPERFLENEKHNIIPYTFMAFGEGPRQCLGKQFSKMQTLAGLATIFKNNRVEFLEDTPRELTQKTMGMLYVPDTYYYLKFVARHA